MSLFARVLAFFGFHPDQDRPRLVLRTDVRAGCCAQPIDIIDF